MRVLDIENILKGELDEKCQKILFFMLLKRTYESDPVRFNELFHEVQKVCKISKPSFNEHLTHLKNKKYIKRKRKGKQEVIYYLNKKAPAIFKLVTMRDIIDEEKETLINIAKKSNFLAMNLPKLLTLFFVSFELHKTKLMLEQVYLPEKKRNENALAFAWQMKQQDDFERRLLFIMIALIQRYEEPETREIAKNTLLKNLDDAISFTQKEFAELAKQ